MVKTSKNSNGTNTIKFICSYGGKILPRYPDGNLRYVGGIIRIVAVDRCISFAELLVKLGELYGSSVNLRCQLPTLDMDALVSVTSDEDLANIIEEYDRANNPSLKIRAFLSASKSIKKISPPPSSTPSITNPAESKSSKPIAGPHSFFPAMVAASRCVHQISPVTGFPFRYEKPAGKLFYHSCAAQHRYPSHFYLLHNGNHWH